MTADTHLITAVENHVGTIVFNNPAKPNALTSGMWQGLHDTLAHWASDGRCAW